MKAVRFDRYGSTDVLYLAEVADPQAGPGQVVVRVRATGINPGEAKIRDGSLDAMWPAHFPEGEGSDFSGVVEAIGPDVDTVRVGDAVFGFTNDRAGHAELVRTEAADVVPKPDALSWEQAGGLFVAGTTAYALVDTAQLQPGDTVVVSGAAGGVGSLTVQLARARGATVIGIAGPDNHEWLRAHGATPVDYHVDDLAGAVRAAAGRPVDTLIDTYGAEYVQLGFDLGVAPKRILTVVDFSAGDRGVTVVSHSVAATAAVLSELGRAVADGSLEIPIAATFPLADVRNAYDELAKGHTRGKIVLIP